MCTIIASQMIITADHCNACPLLIQKHWSSPEKFMFANISSPSVLVRQVQYFVLMVLLTLTYCQPSHSACVIDGDVLCTNLSCGKRMFLRQCQSYLISHRTVLGQ